jgi:hypothetical protein
MKDNLIRHSPFVISSASGKREITFKEDGTLEDTEYSSWRANSETILLNGENISAKVTYMPTGKLNGFDSNDSGVEVVPQLHQKKDFIDSFLPNIRSDIISIDSSIKIKPEVKTKIAVISTSTNSDFDTYNPRRERLSEIFDKLFSNGYQYVVFGYKETINGRIFLSLQTLGQG